MDLIKSGIKNIIKSKTRSCLTVLGVTIGIFTLVIISSLSKIGTNEINSRLSKMGIESVMVNLSDSCGKTLSSDTVEVIKQIKGVKEAVPLMMEISTMSTPSKKSVKTMVWGTDSKAGDILSFEVLHGRLINAGDVAYKNKVCIIDEELAYSTFGRSNAVGKNAEFLINGSYEQFEIVGVVNSGMNTLQSLVSEIVPRFVYMPYTTMQNFTGRTGVDEIAVKLASSDESDEIGAKIKWRLNLLYGEKDAVGVGDLLKQKSQLDGIIKAISVTLSLVAGISLIVSALSIMTIMLVSVSERTREIGIKKSLGATNFDIMKEIVVESMLITVLGSLIGIIAGCGIVFVACKIININCSFNIGFIAFSLVLSILAGAVIGVYPAYKAAKLHPVEALRRET